MAGCSGGGDKSGDSCAQAVSSSAGSNSISGSSRSLFRGFIGDLRLGLGAPLFLGAGGLHVGKPLFLGRADDPELPETAIRYVPQPARARLIEMFAGVDLRLIASGHVHQRRDFTFRNVRHVWAPSAGFKINDARQDRIAIKETGLVEYRFAPDSVEVRHVRAAGQVDVDIEEILAQLGREH